MKKVGVLLLGLFFMFSLSVSAATPNYDAKALKDVEKVVEKGNKEIDKKIEKAVAEANNATKKADAEIEKISRSNKAESEKAEEIAKIEEALYAAYVYISEKLVDETNAIADRTKQYGEERGFEIICELVPVQIGTITVMIDPMRVGLSEK